MMVLLGAHYIPFVFLYGMRMFAVMAALIVAGGLVIAIYWSSKLQSRRVVHERGAYPVRRRWQLDCPTRSSRGFGS